jgi:hypothetical protein
MQTFFRQALPSPQNSHFMLKYRDFIKKINTKIMKKFTREEKLKILKEVKKKTTKNYQGIVTEKERKEADKMITNIDDLLK